MVVDSPPGTGDEPLSVCQLLSDIDGAVLVATPQETALEHVRKSLNFCRTLGVRVLGVIENMSGFVCPHCGETTDVFGREGAARMAAEMGTELLGAIPLDPVVVQASDAGRPYVYYHGSSSAGQAMLAAVEKIVHLLEPDSDGGGAMEITAFSPENEEVAVANSDLRMAIPTSGGKLCAHFGHCERFAILDVDRSTSEIVASRYVEAPEHEPGLLPRWLAGKQVGLILAGGMGQRAQQLFKEAGIEVVVGAPPEDPEFLAKEYLQGRLTTGENVCDH
jgi:ATP-binding protein involved in chromosome partitioning